MEMCANQHKTVEIDSIQIEYDITHNDAAMNISFDSECATSGIVHDNVMDITYRCIYFDRILYNRNHRYYKTNEKIILARH